MISFLNTLENHKHNTRTENKFKRSKLVQNKKYVDQKRQRFGKFRQESKIPIPSRKEHYKRPTKRIAKELLTPSAFRVLSSLAIQRQCSSFLNSHNPPRDRKFGTIAMHPEMIVNNSNAYTSNDYNLSLCFKFAVFPYICCCVYN